MRPVQRRGSGSCIGYILSDILCVPAPLTQSTKSAKSAYRSTARGLDLGHLIVSAMQRRRRKVLKKTRLI